MKTTSCCKSRMTIHCLLLSDFCTLYTWRYKSKRRNNPIWAGGVPISFLGWLDKQHISEDEFREIMSSLSAGASVLDTRIPELVLALTPYAGDVHGHYNAGPGWLEWRCINCYNTVAVDNWLQLSIYEGNGYGVGYKQIFRHMCHTILPVDGCVNILHDYHNRTLLQPPNTTLLVTSLVLVDHDVDGTYYRVVQ